MRAQNELLDAIQILIDKSMADRSTRITGGAVKSASGGLATVTINGYDYSIPYSGTAPTVGSTVRVFIPNGNMSDAFIGGGGGGGSSTTNYNSLTNKPSINGTTLSGNKTSTELGVYGTGNQPPYPVTSVNGQTGDVTIEAGGVTSVNGKSGDVTLTASDVGALPSTTKIPSATSDLTNDSGYITAAGAPVQSVDGKTGAVTLSKGDVGLGNVDNIKQYSADNPPPYPVTSVNGETGAVNLDIPTIPDNLVKYNVLEPVEATTPVNADTLQGHAASYFATATGLSDVQSALGGKLNISGGTMAGALIAQANTNYTTAQVRNVIISPNDPSGGNNGDIWIKYVE